MNHITTHQKHVKRYGIVLMSILMGALFAWQEQVVIAQSAGQNDQVRVMRMERELETWVGQLGSPMVIESDLMQEVEDDLTRILEQAKEVYREAYSPDAQAGAMHIQLRVLHNLALSASATNRSGGRVRNIMQMRRDADMLEATDATGSAFAADYWRAMAGLLELENHRDAPSAHRQAQSIQMLEELVRTYHDQRRGQFQTAYQDALLRLIKMKLEVGITATDIERLRDAFPPNSRAPGHHSTTLDEVAWYGLLFGLFEFPEKQKKKASDADAADAPTPLVQPGEPLLIYLGPPISAAASDPESDAQPNTETAQDAQDAETQASEETPMPVPRQFKPLVDQNVIVVQCPINEDQARTLSRRTNNPPQWIRSNRIEVYGGPYQTIRNRLFDPPELFVRLGVLGEPPVWPLWLWVDENGRVVGAGPRPMIVR